MHGLAGLTSICIATRLVDDAHERMPHRPPIDYETGMRPGAEGSTKVRMKSFAASRARQNLAAILDEAESGKDVIIERRGVRFLVTKAPAPRRASSHRTSRIEVLDPALVDGQWHWTWGPEGEMELAIGSARTPRKKPRR